ncbi:MAG: deoxynucleoside kinase [Parcubacteria group bacterium]|nr:deoxynucleoside kinase [Parcubacteria group bacterium]
MPQGKMIVIDGADGSGKATQFKLLLKRLQDEDLDVFTMDFPQYGKKSAGAVEEYLNGKYGSAESVGPYRGSILFAVDRYDASFEMRKALDDGKIILCNRYVTANMAHQGGKIADEAERLKYFAWLKELEFGIFDIPQPNINIFLHVPPEIALELIDKKGHRDYIGGEGRDLHEADLKHQKDTEKVYRQLGNILPNTFTIECAPDNKLMTPDAIHEQVWSAVKAHI